MTPEGNCSPPATTTQDWQEISDPAVMAKTPLVSVWMITYNHEAYISKAIEGVLQQQTTFPIELVIGEDCSSDGTRKIVLDYQKKHPDIIRVLISESNVGIHANAKRVTTACRGKYVAYCEGDDYWHDPKKLQIQIDYLEGHPECGLVHSDVLWNNVVTGKIRPLKCRNNLIRHSPDSLWKFILLARYRVSTCSAVVRKNLLDDIHSTCQYEFSDYFPSVDRQIWIEFAHRSEVKYIDLALATYNQLPESACHVSDVQKRLKPTLKGLELILHYVDKYGGSEAAVLKKRILNRCIVLLVPLALMTRQDDLTQKLLAISKKHMVPPSTVARLCFLAFEDTWAGHFVRHFLLCLWRFRNSQVYTTWRI